MQSEFVQEYLVAPPTLEYVGVGRRFLALLIDELILSMISVMIGLALHSGLTTVHNTLTYNSSGPGATLQFILPFVYYAVMEAMMGATLGKIALGLHVVNLDGSPISWRESVIRNLFRVIDEIPFFFPYLLAAILVWQSPTKQRLGDRIAKTVVVRRR